MPWEKFLSSPSVWLLSLQYFCQNFSWYFSITWMATFLKATFPVSSDNEPALAGCVPLCGAAVMLLLSVGLQQRAEAGGGVLFGIAALLAMGLASFGNDLSMPGSWRACIDIGGKHTDPNWSVAFLLVAAVYAVGGVAWLFIDPVTPLEGGDHH